MSEPVRVGELLPGVLGEVVDRAGPGYDCEDLVGVLPAGLTPSTAGLVPCI